MDAFATDVGSQDLNRSQLLWRGIEGIGTEHDQIGVLARCKRSAHVLNAEHGVSSNAKEGTRTMPEKNILQVALVAISVSVVLSGPAEAASDAEKCMAGKNKVSGFVCQPGA